MVKTVAAMSLLAGLIGPVSLAEDATKRSSSALRAGSEIYEVGLGFDPDRLRTILPPTLREMPGASGGIAGYLLRDRAGVAVARFGYLWADVRGHDSPTGAAARYILRGFHTQPQLQHGLASIRPGTLAIAAEGDVVRVAAGRRSADEFSFEILPAHVPAQQVEAVTHYIHPAATGGLVLTAVHASFLCGNARPLSVHAGMLSEDGTLRCITWANVVRDVQFTTAIARPI